MQYKGKYSLRNLFEEAPAALPSRRDDGQGRLTGKARTIIRDLYIGKLTSRKVTGDMGEDYAQLLFPGETTSNTNPDGVGADSAFADVLVGDRYYSVKASAPGDGSASASAILSNAEIKTKPIATAIERGEIPTTQSGGNEIAKLGAILFGLSSDDVGPTRVRAFVYEGDLTIEKDGSGKVVKIAGEEPTSKKLGATALAALFPDNSVVFDVQPDENEKKKIGAAAKSDVSMAGAANDAFTRIRLIGNRIAQAMERGDSDDVIQGLKKDRKRLEKTRAGMEAIFQAIENGQEFRVVVDENTSYKLSARELPILFEAIEYINSDSRGRRLMREACGDKYPEVHVDMDGRMMDYGHTKSDSHEGRMTKAKLFRLAQMAQRLHDKLFDADDLPEWVQDKITTAEDRLMAAHNYITYKIHRLENK